MEPIPINMFFRASLTPVAALFASASLHAQQTILTPPVFETIVNGDFSLPIIGQGARKEAADPVTWDYWAGIPGWSAYYGKNIELQTLWANPLPTPVGSAQYCELKAHGKGHYGITQLVGTVKNKTYLLAMDCAARPAIAAVESNFEIRIDSRTAQKVSFAAIGTNKWITKYVVFKATKAITQISLVPNDNPNDTTGCLVDNVRFVPVEFEVTDWNVNLTQPKAPYLYDFGNPIYTSVVIGDPVTDGTATFELTTKVRMKALPIPATDADKIAQEWTCKILQNITDLPVIPTRKYQLGTQKTTLVPIPCSDPTDQYPSGFDKKSFKKATDVLELHHKDSPLDKPPIYINSNEPPLQSSLGNDILLLAKGQTTFVTWVYVENKLSGEKKYLKWVRWKDNWNVDVNALVLPATVKDNGIVYITKEGEGDGKGSAEPSFRKRNIVFSYERIVR